MAQRMGVEVDPARIEDFLVDVFYKNRNLRNREATEGGSKEHTWNAVSQFIKFASIRNVIITDVFTERGGRIVKVRNEKQLTQLSRGPLFYHIATEERKIRLSKKAFYDYLREQKIQGRSVLIGLARHYGATIDQFKVKLGGGTHWATVQEDVIEFAIPEGLYEELLDGIDDPSPEEPPA